MTANRSDIAAQILAYELGELDEDETLGLFQDLVDSGLAWRLQGHYGRTASLLLDAGLITAPPDPDDVEPEPEPPIGTRSICSICGLEIEYHGPDVRTGVPVWLDRGGNRSADHPHFHTHDPHSEDL